MEKAPKPPIKRNRGKIKIQGKQCKEEGCNKTTDPGQQTCKDCWNLQVSIDRQTNVRPTPKHKKPVTAEPPNQPNGPCKLSDLLDSMF